MKKIIIAVLLITGCVSTEPPHVVITPTPRITGCHGTGCSLPDKSPHGCYPPECQTELPK